MFGAFAVVFEAEADVVFVVVKQAEVTVACEAVLRQGVAVAAIAVFAVFQFADDGKEDRRTAFPVARIALPWFETVMARCSFSSRYMGISRYCVGAKYSVCAVCWELVGLVGIFFC